MATIKAEYYRLNGSVWDLYYFKTTADLIAETAEYKVLTAAERTKISEYLSTFNVANKLLKLDASGKIPGAIIPSLNYLPIGGGTLVGGDQLIRGIKGLHGVGGGEIQFNSSGIALGLSGAPVLGISDIGGGAHISANGYAITSVGDPVLAQDAVNKQWVEQKIAQGTHVVGAVRAASIGNVATLSGSTMKIDNVSLVVEDRVLLKDQTTASENGVYIVNEGAWTRVANDSDKGSLTFVLEGASNKGKQFYNKNGTTWELFFIQDTYYAALNRGLELDSTGFGFGIKNAGVTNAMIAGVSHVKVSAIPVTDEAAEGYTWALLKNHWEGTGETTIESGFADLGVAIALLRGTTTAFTNNSQTISGAYSLANSKNRVATGSAVPSSASGYNTGDIYLRTLS